MTSETDSSLSITAGACQLNSQDVTGDSVPEVVAEMGNESELWIFTMSGGILTNVTPTRTLESKLVPNLYLAGEVLDLDGPIGGYNFQAAWSTGHLAGLSV